MERQVLLGIKYLETLALLSGNETGTLRRMIGKSRSILSRKITIENLYKVSTICGQY
jgi:hypothetical protein